MKLFEIIFILLLLLPIALLMRYFISKLSAQTPKQSRVSAAYEKKPSIREWWYNRKAKKQPVSGEAEEDELESAGTAAAGRSYEEHRGSDTSARKSARRKRKAKARKHNKEAEQQPEPQRPADGFVPRSPNEIKRTERVPFTEIYGDDYMKEVRRRQSGGGNVNRSVSRRETVYLRNESSPQESTATAKERLEERRADARKKVSRSETEPTKRQKRNNRRRARQRELNRKNKEQ